MTGAPAMPGGGLPERGLRFMRRLLGGWMLRKWEVHLRGDHHVPDSGPVILASNHLGWLDGPLLFVRTPRPVHALVKSEEFDGKWGRLLRLISQIKVTRDRVDSGALRQAAVALHAGQVIGLFPEGRRGDGELTRIKHGAAYLALLSGAPVVPVAIFGTRERGGAMSSRPPKGARIDMVFGEPIRFPAQPWPRDRAMIGEVGEQIHAHLSEHLTWAKNATRRELPGPIPTGASADV